MEAKVEPRGLTSDEARRRLASYGPNAIRDEEPAAWRRWLAKLNGPVPWMLEAAIGLQVALGKPLDAAVIAALLLFNASLAFVQEGRAAAALAALKQRLAPTAAVLRDGQWITLAASQLVPGDVVRLALGALVPADARAVSGSVLVDASAVTGESLPAEAAPGELLYAGAVVRGGSAIAEVTATGSRTYYGRAAELVRIARESSLQQAAILSVTRSLALVNGIVAALLVLYAYSSGHGGAEIVQFLLTALLATVPVALPATFTLSAAVAAQAMARRGVLLTRLSAAHEAAAMDVLCADKTGTLTRSEIRVARVVAVAPETQGSVLALAALASTDGTSDPIDAAVRAAALASPDTADRTLVDFVPFDPQRRFAEASAIDARGRELRVFKGAMRAVAQVARVAAPLVDEAGRLEQQGHRVIAVAAGEQGAVEAVGLLALSDPPRPDAAGLVSELAGLGVRTVMITGDAEPTARAVGAQVGIAEVFARVLPQEKYDIVKRLQADGHVVGMCGDGVNDAPALRQAQVGIAVASATDAAKSAAAMVMTRPGLEGAVFAVREGRIAFQRLTAYALNMMVKKIEVVLFLGFGLLLTGEFVLTPTLMVLLMMTNDFLAMSLTTDRATADAKPGRWDMRALRTEATLLAAVKLVFSVSVLAWGKFVLGLGGAALATLAFVTLVFGSEAALFVLRERGRFWSSRPGNWLFASLAFDVLLACGFVVSGTLMQPLRPAVLVGTFAAAVALAFVLDEFKLLATRARASR